MEYNTCMIIIYNQFFFVISGERLDSKHCETLEEILRRVQFRTFDLENTHLDDEVRSYIHAYITYKLVTNLTYIHENINL